jgi:two-component system KDP operon response regulator KdpE
MEERRGLVLVIEQDWRIRKLIRANLEAQGLAVHVAIDCAHAMAHVRECGTDLILLEQDAQEMEVLPFLASLSSQADGRHLPVIIMSAEAPDRELLKNGQVTSYLQKPFAASALLHHVERALVATTPESRATDTNTVELGPESGSGATPTSEAGPVDSDGASRPGG